jgi:tetratricopeptide (TPR) repeat protein
MIRPLDLESQLPPVTDGTIAAINLRSARLHSWGTFWRTPERPGIAETIVEHELLTAQFFGDANAFERPKTLADQFVRAKGDAAETFLIAAHVACATHRFGDATAYLAKARARPAPSDAMERLSLILDQATGHNLDRVLAARRARASGSGRWAELVPLGSLLADLGEFDEAEAVYIRALREYRDASPFALAGACFELGMLWGERVPAPHVDVAAEWYSKAINYIPSYVKARVHLAEIFHDRGAVEEVCALLEPAIESGDPEVYWRLAEAAEGANQADAAKYLEAARSGFESLLARHPLAFADHAAEFFLSGGSNPKKAFELAQVNVANRPTLAAFELAFDAALATDEPLIAHEFATRAEHCWAGSAAFTNSPLATYLRSLPTRLTAPNHLGTVAIQSGAAHD